MTGTRLVVGEGRVFWEVPSLQPSRNDGQDLPWPPKRLKVPWAAAGLGHGRHMRALVHGTILLRVHGWKSR